MINSAEDFVRLRTSDNTEDYRRAANEAATLETWLQVIGGFPDMSVWVAQNKSVPPEVLEILARHQDASVRFMVAMKNSLSVELIRALAADSDSSVRQRIAYNKKTPRDVLELLSRDCEPLVSERAVERLWAESSD